MSVMQQWQDEIEAGLPPQHPEKEYLLKTEYGIWPMVMIKRREGYDLVVETSDGMELIASPPYLLQECKR